MIEIFKARRYGLTFKKHRSRPNSMLRQIDNNFKQQTTQIAPYIQSEFENDTLTLDVYDMLFGRMTFVKLCVEMVMIHN